MVYANFESGLCVCCATALSFTAFFDSGYLIWWGWVGWGWVWLEWDGGLSGMEENKKSGGGDVRAEALAWDDEWDKA